MGAAVVGDELFRPHGVMMPSELHLGLGVARSSHVGEGHTEPPKLLTEADLIALMDKHGIGTDATHAEHIETVKSREYVFVEGGDKLVPGKLAMALVDGRQL